MTHLESSKLLNFAVVMPGQYGMLQKPSSAPSQIRDSRAHLDPEAPLGITHHIGTLAGTWMANKSAWAT